MNIDLAAASGSSDLARAIAAFSAPPTSKILTMLNIAILPTGEALRPWNSLISADSGRRFKETAILAGLLAIFAVSFSAPSLIICLTISSATPAEIFGSCFVIKEPPGIIILRGLSPSGATLMLRKSITLLKIVPTQAGRMSHLTKAS